MPACPSCHADVLAGVRWCGICHTNIIKPNVGRLASPAKRLGAYFLDLLIPTVAFIVMLTMVAGGTATGSEAGVGLGLILAIGMFIAYAVWALMLFANGTTPGKQMLGLRVVRESGELAGFGTMLVREWIGKLISGMILSLGFLWILIDRDRQGWHDKLVSTYVVE
jgi:uncharacterized RDD family membrane protein YckC